MRKKGTFGGVVLYTIIALVLGIITYAEFAIVQWPTFSSNITFIGLYVLSIVKFVLVIMFFMHLKNDHKMLSGLFAAGMIVGGATVALLLFLFTGHNIDQLRGVEEEISTHGEEAHVEIPEADFSQSMSRPAPKAQEPLAIVGASVTGSPPSASLPDFDNLGGTGSTSHGNNDSEQATESEDVEEVASEEVKEAATDFDWQELGETTFSTCQACHQANGEGIPGAFPPLKEHMPELYNAEGGRKYIINVVLYGLQGQIGVKGSVYYSAMSPHSHLTDEQIAAVLNHELNSWGNDELVKEFSPILPEEVAIERENPLSPTQVLELRPDFSKAAQEPVEEQPIEEVVEEVVADFDWEELGKTTFNTCQACHQANGEGIPSAFPPLKGHITELYNAEGGRKYIINVVLYGLQGNIEVKGTSYGSAMSPQNFLSDEQIAAVLNHELNSWGNDELLEEFSPILPDEVAIERENTLSLKQVLELRPDLP